MINGDFKYVSGWYAIYVGKNSTIERHGPYETEEECKAERLKLQESKCK